MNKWEIILYIVVFLCLVGIFLPSLNSTHWLVRGQEYLKIYYLLLATILLAITIVAALYNHFQVKYWIVISLLLLGIINCAKDVIPHSFFYWKEIKDAEHSASPNISVLIFNVLQSNDQYKLLIDIIAQTNPDLILLLETDQTWEQALVPLKENYPYVVKKIQDNNYGMMLFSKHKYVEKIVRDLYEKDTPAIEAMISKDGHDIRIMGIHPKPPVPEENGSSKPKDKEIEKAAKVIDKRKDSTLQILAGDLNDVAWSKSAYKLKEITNLKDPRIGRGTYNTFPTNFPFKIPIDLIFCSSYFELIEMSVLDDIGSDHYPFFINLKLPSK